MPAKGYRKPPLRTEEIIRRFEQFIVPEPNSGCWLWNGYVDENGYGRFSPEFRVSPIYAHRFSYVLHKGAIPRNLTIDHLCFVRCCVNPDHLEAVTQLENTRRGIPRRQKKTHCPRGHEYTPDSVYVMKDGRKVCKTCDKARGKEKYQRKKQ